jgi:hypothetical protein
MRKYSRSKKHAKTSKKVIDFSLAKCVSESFTQKHALCESAFHAVS